MAEALTTIIALEGLFFGVDVAMVAQVVLTTEGLAADITRIWPLIRVGSLVNQKIVGLCEVSVAVFTDELLLGTCAGRPGDF